MNTIILLGPSKSGKTTVGNALATELGRPFQALSAFNIDYFERAGLPDADLQRAWTRGFESWLATIQPFVPAVLEAFISRHTGGVLELDPMLLLATDPAIRAEIMRIVAPHQRVLLLPTQDVAIGVRVLHDRQRIMYNGMDLNDYFVRHPANYLLAKHIVYTKGRTAQQTAEDVLAVVEGTSPIILIGPMQTGKSTVAQAIADARGLVRASLDQHRWRYYVERGFDLKEMRRIDEQFGTQGVIEYWKRFDVHAVDRFLEEHTEGVLDFGAGHSVYDVPADLDTVQRRMEPFPNVVLLIPATDPEESFAILSERSTLRVNGIEITEYVLTTPSLYDMANAMVYTEGQTPEETAQDVLARLSRAV